MKTKKAIKRIRTNVTLTPALFQKVKDYDLNLSSFLQIKLAEYFAYIEGNTPHTQTIQTYTPETHHQGTPPPPGKTPGKNSELYGEVGLLRFERKSLAPKAKRMDQATLQAPAYTV